MTTLPHFPPAGSALLEGQHYWRQEGDNPPEMYRAVNGRLVPTATPEPPPFPVQAQPRAPRPDVPKPRRWLDEPAASTTPPAPKLAPQESRTMSTTPTVNTDARVSGVVDWTKRAFAAGAEGAKDGAALAVAETLTAGVIAAVSVEAPIILTIYNSSALAQKILQVAVPYTVGLVATLGWLPRADDVASLCERALRAAVVTNVAPILSRFKLPIMRVVENAMDMDRAASRMASGAFRAGADRGEE